MDLRRKILIIGPAWVGDMIMAQALFKYIKSRDANTTIDIVAPSWSHGLFSRMPEIDKIIEIPLGHAQLQLGVRWKLGKSLRARKYQQAIVLPNSWKSAIVPFTAGISTRTGWLGEMRFWLLNDWKILRKNKLSMMVQRFLALGDSPIAEDPVFYEAYQPSLSSNPQDAQNILKRFSPEFVEGKPLLVLCPGAAFGPSKCWPSEYFAEVAQQKLSEGWQVCLLGSKSDSAIGKTIQELTKNLCFDLTGQTSLTQALDVLSIATHVISNDSGLMHCAAALGRPLIALYGSSSPAFTPPLTQRKRILTLKLPCSPCFQRTCPLTHFNCLKELRPHQVLNAMNELN